MVIAKVSLLRTQFNATAILIYKSRTEHTLRRVYMPRRQCVIMDEYTELEIM